MYLIDAAQQAAALTAQRSGLLFSGGFATSGGATSGGVAFRSGAASIADVSKTIANVAATPFCVVGRNYGSQTRNSVFPNVIGNESDLTTTSGNLAPASIDTVTLGSRRAASAYGLSLDGCVFRVLIHGRALSIAEVTSVLQWANAIYGMPTSSPAASAAP